MINEVYVYFTLLAIGVCLVIFFIRKTIKKHHQEVMIKKMATYHEKLALTHQNFLTEDGHITGKAREVVDKIHILDKNVNKNKNFITTLEYKLIYAYENKPLKNAIILYVKSCSVLLVVPYFLKFPPIVSFIFSGLVGLYVTFVLINRLFDKKIGKFLDNFVYAMDIIVRGVRSGLPLNVCFQKITEDVDIVVGEQFLAIIDDFRLGMTLDQAMNRFMQRMPFKEVNFFCLSLMIQGKTGGNLAEIINNLAITLRKRKSMILKIQTLSSEARSSMKIMMCLPVLVVLILKFMVPDYINVLFEDGKLVLFGCIIWMSIGGFIMSQMVRLVK